MYAPFFGLKQPPFSIAPDPRYLYMSERHREALAHLLYGIGGGGGFVVLTGEIGAGKTTVCRCFLEQVPPHCLVAYIVNPKLTVIELLQTVCDEFRIAVAPSSPPTVKDYIDPLNRFLLDAHAGGRQAVLVIDEAQNLAAEVLEQLRLLTNLETDERKLLQILLIGQPELRHLLARPDLEQLAQRVIARYHLGALSEAETAAYVAHRLAVAGGSGAQPFDRGALNRVHALARGVPRRINLLCDRALLGAYGSSRPRVDAGIVERAAAEVFDLERLPWWRRRGVVVGAGLAGAALIVLGSAALDRERRAAGAAGDVGAPVPAAASRAPDAAASAPPPLAAASGAAAAASDATRAGASAEPAAAVSGAEGASAANGAVAEAALTDTATVFDALPRDSRRAWRDLAQAWGWTTRDADPCANASAGALQCLRGSGATPALLRLLDRPVLLTLHDGSGATRLVRLAALDERHAWLAGAEGRWTVALGDLARYWRGGYATFWRAPPAYAGALGAGASGAAVDALASGLARLDGDALPPAGQRLGGELAAKLAAFQLAQGLQSDGVAGPTTFIRLNRALGVDEPRLERPSAR